MNANISSTVMQISSGNIGDLVIKQYYYGGSSTKLGAGIRDHFIEIHNNSAETIFADGLYIALTEGNIDNKVASYTLANGQYDWSQTAGGGAAANTDFIYANTIIRIPGMVCSILFYQERVLSLHKQGLIIKLLMTELTENL